MADAVYKWTAGDDMTMTLNVTGSLAGATAVRFVLQRTGVDDIEVSVAAGTLSVGSVVDGVTELTASFAAALTAGKPGIYKALGKATDAAGKLRTFRLTQTVNGTVERVDSVTLEPGLE